MTITEDLTMVDRTDPVIPGFHPDPSICRVGDDYYLATSSFEYFPGVPIFHSTDLVHWTQIGHALTRRSQFPLVEPGPSRGIYAPTLRHHDGRFWLITTNVSDVERGQVLVTTADPRGEWSEPVFVPEARGIDPDLAWDVDGTCYLTWNELRFGAGNFGIRQAPFDPTTGRLLEEPYPLWEGTGMQAPEGAHLYRVGATWYLMLAEGGTERGHSVTIARGQSPRGPFEPCPRNPILSHRSTDHPVQNVGHADLVETPTGEWAAVYLGVRPGGSTPGYHVNGRETFLAGIEWEDGWPRFDETAFAGAGTSDTAFADDFSGEALDLRWVTPDGEPEACTRTIEAGIELVPRDGGLPALCARITDARWRIGVRFARDGQARVWMDPGHWYGIRRSGDRILVEGRIGSTTAVLSDVTAVDTVSLEIRAVDPRSLTRPLGDAGPDEIVFSTVSEAGLVTDLFRADGRYLSTEVASGFTGRMIALSADGSPATLLGVSYESTTNEG